MNRQELLDNLYANFPSARFVIKKDLVNNRERFAISYKNIEEDILRSFVRTLSLEEVYYFNLKEEDDRYIHP